MAYPKKLKDPDAVLDFSWPWKDEGWLQDDDAIDTAVFAIYTATGEELPDSDLTPLAEDSSSATTESATIWLSGGTPGTSYLVTCHITTTAGREDDRSAIFQIKER